MAFGGFQLIETESVYQGRRQAMVKQQLEQRGIRDQAVLAAMSKVPRHRFVPTLLRGLAYSDGPLPIGEGQPISQPYIVALMTELIQPAKTMRVLEIGTGSGYQAAVLSECVAEVYTIEVVPELGRGATTLLRELGHRNVHVKVGDGYVGWPDHAAFRCDRAHRGPAQTHTAALARPAQGRGPPGGAGRRRRAGSRADHADRKRVRSPGDRAGSIRAHDG